MRVRQPPGVPQLTWDAIQGKPTLYPTEWGLIQGRPSVFPTDWELIQGRPSRFPPELHAGDHAAGGADPLSPADIGAATLEDVSDAQSSSSLQSIWLSETPSAFKRLVAWGGNNRGQLGTNNTSSYAYPVRVLDPTGVSWFGRVIQAVAAGQMSYALLDDGTVWAWGFNDYGQLGDGTTIQRLLPVQVLKVGGEPLTDIVAIDAGPAHGLALDKYGQVWAWGFNEDGELGDGTVNSPRPYADRVLGPGGTGYLTGIVAIGCGSWFSMALRDDGTVWGWGENSTGQLGDNTTQQRLTPVQVRGAGGSGYLTGVVALAVGGSYALAQLADGTVWAWGDNYHGQLGDGTYTERRTPVQVRGLGGVGWLTGVRKLAAGQSTSLALLDDGTVLAWGRGDYGQRGDGTTQQNQYFPVQVKGPGGLLTGIVDLAAGDLHSVALRADGTVWAWGTNSGGQLGDGTMTQRTIPVQVKGLNNQGYLSKVISISAGAAHTLARCLV